MNVTPTQNSEHPGPEKKTNAFGYSGLWDNPFFGILMHKLNNISITTIFSSGFHPFWSEILKYQWNWSERCQERILLSDGLG